MAALDHHLAPLLRHFGKNVEELHANAPGYLRLVRPGGKNEEVPAPELTLEWWRDLLSHLCNLEGRVQGADERQPIVGALLPGGHRIQLHMGDHVHDSGVAAVVRLKHARRWDLGAFDLSKAQQERIKRGVAERENILVSGGTFTGKTAFLNALLALTDKTDRLVTVEDVPELDTEEWSAIRNVVRFRPVLSESREDVSYQLLMDGSVRLSPTRLLLGELRIDNTWLALKALNTGHDGFMATIHASSAELAVQAIQTNVLLNPEARGVPEAVLERVILQRIDLIVQLQRDHKTGRRFVSELRDLATERGKAA